MNCVSNDAQKLKDFEVTQGKYLLRISGIYTTNTGQMGCCDKVTFIITIPGKEDKKKVDYFMHSVSGYSYPFSFEEIVDCAEGELKV